MAVWADPINELRTGHRSWNWKLDLVILFKASQKSTPWNSNPYQPTPYKGRDWGGIPVKWCFFHGKEWKIGMRHLIGERYPLQLSREEADTECIEDCVHIEPLAHSSLHSWKTYSKMTLYQGAESPRETAKNSVPNTRCSSRGVMTFVNTGKAGKAGSPAWY